MVPASGWHGPPPLGAVVADALATGAAVMDGEAGGELPLALAAAVDVLVRDPVSRASCVFHQAWMHRGWLIRPAYVPAEMAWILELDLMLTQRYVDGTNYGS